MSDNTDRKDPFEEFFQKKAGDYNIPFREEDWLKLKNKLDLRDAQIAHQRKLGWVAAASILIVCLLGYFTYDNYSRLNQISQQLHDEVTNNLNQGNNLENPENDLGNQVPNTPDKQEETIVENNTESKRKREDVVNSRETKEESQPDMMVAEIQNIDKNKNKGKAIPDVSLLTEINYKSVGNDIPVTSKTSPNITYASPLNTKLAVKNTSSQVNPTTYLAESENYNPGHQAFSRFSLGLVAAPDLSAVGSFSDFHGVGYKFGLTVAYAITPDLAFSTGLVQANVKYSAQSQDYNPSYYRGYNMTPDQIFAECLILDIPINIKYNFLNLSRSRFFATAGLSSYIMMNEQYDFSYDTSYPGQTQSWSDRTGTRHWFSNAGFSMGYELDILERWSIQAEPFIKIPIKEIGWGKVKLYSLGSLISVNYRL